MAKLDSMHNKSIIVSMTVFVAVVGGSYVYLSYPAFTYEPAPKVEKVPSVVPPVITTPTSSTASTTSTTTPGNSTGGTTTASTSIQVGP